MELTERRADLRTTFFIYDMLYIFVTETLQSTDDRKRCTLTESAQGHALNHVCKLFQLIQIGKLTLTCNDSLQDLKHTFGTLTAGNTFTTALTLCKAHEETRNLYHTGILIHNNKSTGTHDGIQLLNRIKIKRMIDLIVDQTSTRRTADLYTLKCSTALKTAADVINDMTEACSHRHLDKASVLNGTGK